jgi:hypothetical protein
MDGPLTLNHRPSKSLALDEAAGCCVADFCIVLPTVPEPTHHLHEVRRLVEAIGDRLLDFGLVEVRPAKGQLLTAAEVAVLARG